MTTPSLPQPPIQRKRAAQMGAQRKGNGPMERGRGRKLCTPSPGLVSTMC